MSFPVIPVIVVVQVCLFQFLSVGLTRSMFAVRLGSPPEVIAKELAPYLRNATRHRFTLGALLGLVLLAAVLGWPVNPVLAKLALAVVSVTSAVAFAAAFVRDQRTARALIEKLPESAVRCASLTPRSIGQWYNPAWEVVPILILCSTVVCTLWMGFQTSQLPMQAWILQGLQALFVIGALLYTLRFGTAVPNVSQRLAMLRNRPETALRFGERLAAREMQYLMLAKVAVALLLGVSVIHVALRARHHEMTSWFGAASWILVGFLMLAFASYVVRLVMLVKRMQQEAEQPRNG